MLEFKFKKYEGLGNDFIIIDRPVAPREAMVLCDRRFGIGGDGVLMVLESDRADAKMRILNVDGSEPEMCGNGIRCVAKDLYDSGRVRKPTLRIDTGAGVLECAVTERAGKADSVTVEMGRPKKIREPLDESIVLGDRTFSITSVSMGNPHAVIFPNGTEPLRGLAVRYGPLLERHEWFPQRTNAEFARIVGEREIDLVVWERGCGITLACGTGACATAVAAVLTGRAKAGNEIKVGLPGGALGITVASDLGGVRMRGPARLAFAGECDLEALVERASSIPRAEPPG